MTEMQTGDDGKVAVCAMAARLPGASSIDRFWSNLADGVESVTRFTDEELLSAGEDPELLRNPDYVRARAVLDDVEWFDAGFFGFTPTEAEILDPQIRLFLECAWEALELAGYDPERYKGSISIFAGASFSNYLVHNLYGNRPVMESFGDFRSTIYNLQDALVTLVGYKLNLRGACCAVQTFCSTSLVGTHLACQSLLNYECDMALAGGATVFVPQQRGYLYEEGGIVSPDGTCRAFDAKARGTVFGNGAGVVLLKRLEDALRDGDPIQAVILGSATNNDGSLKVSYAAPGVVGQTEVVVEALAAAGVSPETIEFVETHGTGTSLGDPAEIRALSQAFRTGTEEKGYCAIGSVKTNVGHLDAAAGVAGLIKMVLSLKHGQIPPSLHFESPNPQIDFESSPFYVNTALKEWSGRGGPRRGAVSAFGIGGTNAHVIVEEAPPIDYDERGRSRSLLVLSAKTETALDEVTKRLASHLEAHPELNLADVAYTLQIGRRAFPYRRFVVADDTREAAKRLRDKEGPRASTDRQNPPVVFVFPGDCSADPNRIRDLLESEKAFREAFDACARLARDSLGVDLRGAVGQVTEAPDPVALFAVEYALARLWNQWGVRAESMFGEGVGEIVAACLDEAVRLEGALALAAGRQTRGELESHAYRYPQAISRLPDEPARLFLVVGQGKVEKVGDRRPIESIGSHNRRRGDATPCLMDGLGELWLAGIEPDWPSFYEGQRRRRVPLPTYPFERKRYWVEPLEEEETPSARATGKLADPAQWLYLPSWVRSSPPAVGKPDGDDASRYLLFIDSLGVGAAVAARMRRDGLDVITVEAGDAFRGNPEEGYLLNLLRRDDYDALFEDLNERGRAASAVAHFAGLDPVDRREARGQRSFYSLLFLGQALGVLRGATTIQLKVVTSGAHEVVGDELLSPEKATLLGLCRVLPQEHHNLRCTMLDIEPNDGRAVEQLVTELRSTYRETVVAYRRGKRWIQTYGSLSPERWVGIEPRLRKKGVYFITGGLGEVGSTLAAYLAKKVQARLILSGRSALPPRGEWESWLRNHDGTDATSLRINKVKGLESLGAEVLVVGADVSDPGQMEAAWARALEEFGEIHGVVHAAGVLAARTFRPVRDLTSDICEEQFGPKVFGLEVLDRVLGKKRLDFVFLTSSLSSVLGGLGYGAYAAANLFMDVFAARKNQERATPWISVNWDQWQFASAPPERPISKAAAAELSMSPEEGLATFDTILRLVEAGQVVISAGPLGDRLRRWVMMDEDGADEPSGRSGTEAVNTRPPLATEYVPPRNEHEKTVAKVWQELLGIDQVGIHDDFFELGGHSLFAARVLSRLKDSFGIALPLESMFDRPTVAGLAERIQAVIWAQRGGRSASGDESEDRVEIEL
jgi:acyl transferase domain-containing protein/acyl carrier protein